MRGDPAAEGGAGPGPQGAPGARGPSPPGLPARRLWGGTGPGPAPLGNRDIAEKAFKKRTERSLELESGPAEGRLYSPRNRVHGSFSTRLKTSPLKNELENVLKVVRCGSPDMLAESRDSRRFFSPQDCIQGSFSSFQKINIFPKKELKNALRVTRCGSLAEGRLLSPWNSVQGFF